MELDPIINSEHPDAGPSIAKHTSSISVTPASIVIPEMPSMFNNAQNTLITGGSFNITTSFSVVTGQPLDVLFKRVAPNAILNAGGRADEVRCHPGTREEVIGRIEKWGDAQGDLTPPLFWLSGPAGAGKSAIVQTVAENCKQRGVPHTNFFFFRADTSCSSAFPLIATLVYQLISLCPSLQDFFTTLLSTDPLILDSTLENQLAELIVKPLRTLAQPSSGSRWLILLIDGLDECDSEDKRDQRQILHAFDKILGESCPFRLLVASRDESQIRAAFNKISSPFINLYLDDQYSAATDIRIFVNAQFEQVKREHPLAHTLDAIWPLIADIDYIVEKSSGQFIYAATVMRFISDSAASPLVSLGRVKGVAQLATKSPFAQLDAVYTYILSRADDQEALKDILHAERSIRLASITLKTAAASINDDIKPFLRLLGYINTRYTKEMIISCLADITPIAKYHAHLGNLRFYHASFYDYLLDQSRSREYFVDMAKFHYNVLPVIWQQLVNKRQSRNWWLQFGLYSMTHLDKIPPHFMNVVATTRFKADPTYQTMNSDILQTIYNLCDSNDDIKYYRHLLHNWINSCNHDPFDSIQDKPFGRRFYYMARVNCFDVPDSETFAALHPESDLDRHETSLWLRDSIFSCYRKTRPDDVEGYKRVLNAWIPWAVENHIPCDVFEHLPHVRQYMKKSAGGKRWAERFFNFKIGRDKK